MLRWKMLYCKCSLLRATSFVFEFKLENLGNSATDRLEQELLSEHENARLVRLLCKFGFINERPEYVPPLLPSLSYLLPTFSTHTHAPIDSHSSRVGQKQAIDISSSSSAIMCFIKWTNMGTRL